ncbi:hypothetical protein DFQ28_007804 [Apophysomyces sp. BC1034]|nr:hypothetical protein DFQ28_007804 [Apophysomyces sp. BC1034]
MRRGAVGFLNQHTGRIMTLSHDLHSRVDRTHGQKHTESKRLSNPAVRGIVRTRLDPAAVFRRDLLGHDPFDPVPAPAAQAHDTAGQPPESRCTGHVEPVRAGRDPAGQPDDRHTRAGSLVRLRADQERPMEHHAVFSNGGRRAAHVRTALAQRRRAGRRAEPAGEADRRSGTHQPVRGCASGRDRPECAAVRRRLRHHAVYGVLPAARRWRDFTAHPRGGAAGQSAQAKAARQVHHRGTRNGQGQYRGRRGAGTAGWPDLLHPGHQRLAAVGHADGVPVAAASDRLGTGLGSGRALLPAGRPAMEGDRAGAVLLAGDWQRGQSPQADPGRQGYETARLGGADLHGRRHGNVRHQWLCNRSVDCRAVHRVLGHLGAHRTR